MISATYCSHDNKIRLNPGAERLPTDVYDRVKAAGFTWAPGQKIFIGQMWTPQRFDLALELAGSVEDEDSTPDERAEARAERFGERADLQAEQAERMADAVGEVSSVIGASNRGKAEKMKDKAEAAIQRAVDMWETSEYWAYRAKAALRHAKFKEDPGVRHRRIKGLKADLRTQEKEVEEVQTYLGFWSLVKPLTLEHALRLANTSRGYGLWSDLRDGKITPDEAMAKAMAAGAASIAWHTRWADHYRFRIEFETEMLGESGGIASCILE